MQDLAAAEDVGTLLSTLSATQDGHNLDLCGRYLAPPTECSREGGALWAVPGWPQAAAIDSCNVDKGLHLASLLRSS